MPLDDSLPLDPGPGERRRLLREVERHLDAFLEALPDLPVKDGRGREGAASLFSGPPPETGRPEKEVLELLFDQVIPVGFNPASPGYYAFIPGGGLFVAALADLIAGVVNRYSTVWEAAPAAAELETCAIRWLAELLDLPPGTLGVLTTGGSTSNLLAIAAARDRELRDGDVPDLSRGTIYLSTHTHHSVAKAARVAGVPESRIRRVPVDAGHRMDLDALRSRLREDRAQGLRPFFLCGTAGTVHTGVIDPLEAMADIAASEKLWFHVDGAYGGLFALLPSLRPALSGLRRADSVAVDPHKGLYLPFGTGALLTRHLDALRESFGGGASYLPDAQADPGRLDFSELSSELTRDWRGLRLWLALVLHGVDAFRQALEERRQLALEAHERLASRTDIETTGPPELSLFAFRQVPDGLSLQALDAHNRDLLARINANGRQFLTGIDLGGAFHLRLCVLHLRSDRARTEEAVETIVRELERRSAAH